MALVTLEEVRAHCRAEESDDTMLAIYRDAAEDSAAQYLGRAIYADETEQGDDTEGIVINASIRGAVLLMTGHWFANREAVTAGQAVEVPLSVRWLLDPYRANLGV